MMVRDRGGALQPVFRQRWARTFLQPHGMVNPMISQTGQESNPLRNPDSELGAGYISNQLFLVEHSKSMIPFQLDGRDRAGCRQNIEPHGLTGKILRNKELTADVRQNARDCLSSER